MTERLVPLTHKKSRSHRQPCQEIQIEDNIGKKKSRTQEERIDSGRKKVAPELFGESRYNLQNARQTLHRLGRNGSR